MKEKRTVLVGIGIIMAVIFTMAFYALGASRGGLDFPEYIIMISVIAIALAATWVVADRWKNIKKGLPVKDEMENRISHRAGYYAWLATIWITLGVSFANSVMTEDLGLTGLSSGQMAGAIILLSAMVFFSLYFWFRKKGIGE